MRVLAEAGFETIAAARRLERCEALAAEVGGRAARLDVTDQASIDELAASIDRLDLVVHSAGGALGLEPVAEFDDANWLEMFESNVLGVARVTRALLPALRRADAPAIQIIGSVAGVEAYEGGGGYTAAKHAVHALAQTLRLELLADGIRVTEIAPGLVDTEFSLVRFDGDARARGVGLRRARPAGCRRRRRGCRLLRDAPRACRRRLRRGQTDRAGHGEDRPPRALGPDG